MHNQVGERRQMNNGQYATIIAYRGWRDIDVKFDSGTVVTNKNYGNFLQGFIKDPKTKTPRATATYHLGEKRIMNCGIEATIIKYNNIQDIDVKFPNGEIVCNKRYSSFKQGGIRPPSKSRIKKKDLQKREPLEKLRIGETRRMKAGHKATIINYRSAKDVDVELENGVIKQHISYQNFKNGNVGNLEEKRLRMIGQTKLMSCGLEATIIKKISCKKIDVEFSDNIIRKNVNLCNFVRGTMQHPGLPQKNKKAIELFHGFNVRRLAFTMNDGRVFYEALSPKKEYVIMTPQQMIKESEKD